MIFLYYYLAFLCTAIIGMPILDRTVCPAVCSHRPEYVFPVGSRIALLLFWLDTISTPPLTPGFEQNKIVFMNGKYARHMGIDSSNVRHGLVQYPSKYF